MIDQGFDRFFTAPDFFHGDECAFGVDVQDGFDIEHRSRPGARAAHAAAAEEEHQVIDREPVAQVVAGFDDEVARFVERCAFCGLLACQIHEHALAARCREGLYGAQLALGVFAGEALHQQLDRAECARQRARESQIQDVFSRIEDRAHRCFGFLQVGKGCGDDLAFAHHGVELLEVGFFSFEIAAPFDAVHHERHGQDFQTEFVNHLFAEIAGGVGHDTVCHGLLLGSWRDSFWDYRSFACSRALRRGYEVACKGTFRVPAFRLCGK